MTMDITSLTADEWNGQLMEIMLKKYIIRIFLKDKSSSKYMLIRNKLELMDNLGNIPHHGLQGEDITYHYNYGEFSKNDSSPNVPCRYYSIFHSSGRVVFGERISHIIIYKTEEDICTIDNEIDRDIILRLHRDIKTSNWEPKLEWPY